MDRRTKDTYTAMWEIVFDVIPELKHHVTILHLDGEIAPANAAEEMFDDVHLQLCLFHGSWVK